MSAIPTSSRNSLCALIAINGLLFGLAAEFTRKFITSTEIKIYNSEVAPRFAESHLQLADVQPWALLPIQFFIIFIITGYLVTKYRLNLKTSGILLWQAIAVSSVLIFISFNIMLGPYNRDFLSGSVKYWVAYLMLVIVYQFLFYSILRFLGFYQSRYK